MKTIIKLTIIFSVLLILFCRCEKYLDIKPDKTLAVPKSASDLQAMLDRVQVMNAGYSGLGEISSDNYYLTYSVWQSFSVEEYRDNYIWKPVPVFSNQWSSTYTTVFYANTVVEELADLKIDRNEAQKLEGSARFFRAYAFLHLAQIFAKPYNKNTENTDLGVVLRLSADINKTYERSTLKETYDQILEDLKAAAFLLPDKREVYATRPTKAAAYGALSRTYLSMRDYNNALLYADSCLALWPDLLNYNGVENTEQYPFEPFNKEVIFFSRMNGQSNLVPNNANVDSTLYQAYLESDLRKTLFFNKKADGSIMFTGNYAAVGGGNEFNGITSAEILLTRAECMLRIGNEIDACKDLVKFINNRYANSDGNFDLDNMSKEELLLFTLNERRKELIFRGLRWIDLRRLSFEDGFDIQLERLLNEKEYHLSKQDLQIFAHLIPLEVIERSDIQQN